MVERRRLPDLPAHVGPGEFCEQGRQVIVRGPREFDALLRDAGGEWDAGHRHWVLERRRIGPVIRALERATDPLFWRAGIDLDGDD
jgi:hypothetical protein